MELRTLYTQFFYRSHTQTTALTGTQKTRGSGSCDEVMPLGKGETRADRTEWRGQSVQCKPQVKNKWSNTIEKKEKQLSLFLLRRHSRVFWLWRNPDSAIPHTSAHIDKSSNLSRPDVYSRCQTIIFASAALYFTWPWCLAKCHKKRESLAPCRI